MRDALSLTDQAIAYSANEVTESAVSGMLGALDQTYMVRLLDAPRRAARKSSRLPTRCRCAACRSRPRCRISRACCIASRGRSSRRPVLDEWPEAGDLRRFAETLARAGPVVLSDRDGRSRRARLAPDEYAGFTMTLLRMLAFEPAVAAGSAPVGQPSARVRARPRVAAASAAAAKPVSAAPAEAVRSQAIAPAAPAAPVVRAAPVQSGDETDRPAVKPAAVEAAAPAPVDAPVIETPQPQAAAAPQAEPAGDQPTPVRKEPEPPAAVAQRVTSRLRRPNRCRALRRLSRRVRRRVPEEPPPRSTCCAMRGCACRPTAGAQAPPP